MAIEVTKTNSGVVGLDDITELGFRLLSESALVPGSNPPQYKPQKRWVGFAKYQVGDDNREVQKNSTVEQVKATSGLQLARAMVKEIASKEGVAEGTVES